MMLAGIFNCNHINRLAMILPVPLYNGFIPGPRMKSGQPKMPGSKANWFPFPMWLVLFLMFSYSVASFHFPLGLTGSFVSCWAALTRFDNGLLSKLAESGYHIRWIWLSPACGPWLLDPDIGWVILGWALWNSTVQPGRNGNNKSNKKNKGPGQLNYCQAQKI